MCTFPDEISQQLNDIEEERTKYLEEAYLLYHLLSHTYNRNDAIVTFIASSNSPNAQSSPDVLTDLAEQLRDFSRDDILDRCNYDTVG
ncbi:hypothetical protein T10_12185 [Trichinella papuae]|uniref:Uncharacterized protein n=1 Tax=Trichinella papuae TaxID=268474 RepID=A0A0V1MF91_9BILA|nr:hypothetical protein T10_12185 [Trichinella papuae]